MLNVQVIISEGYKMQSFIRSFNPDESVDLNKFLLLIVMTLYGSSHKKDIGGLPGSIEVEYLPARIRIG